MKNVPANSKRNCLAINMSNFFIRNMFQAAKVQKKDKKVKRQKGKNAAT
jgi:hypothetical protein